MATVVSHAVVAYALVESLRPGRPVPGLYLIGILLAMAPDLDVIGLFVGVDYGALWGHRGMTHSISFAFAMALPVSAWMLYRSRIPGGLWEPEILRFVHLWLLLSACMVSHGLLDMLTNGGLGVAVFSPWDKARHFFEHVPVQVSPIGLHGWTGPLGLAVLRSELLWIVLPSLVVVLVSRWLRRA